MDEQVNIPALGGVCFDIRISYNESAVWLRVPQGRDARPRSDVNSHLRDAQKYIKTFGSIKSYQNRLRWTGREDQGAREKHG